MAKLIGVSGLAGSGKDQFAEYIRDNAYEYFIIKRFGGKLKEICAILLNVDVELFEDQNFKKKSLGPEWGDNMTVRLLLQIVGTECMRDTLHSDVWVNALMNEFNNYKGEPGSWDCPHWLITDVRFPNEANAIKERGGIMIRINRTSIVQGEHPSETALDHYPFDHYIDNNGSIDDLKTTSIAFYNKVIASF